LGGVKVPYPKGLLGHSDGDVLLHAVVDAVLGALGLGDIGEHFSDKDPRFKGADSRLFVRETVRLLAAKKMKIVNIDATIVAEKPVLKAFKPPIRASLAANFKIAAAQVNVKAKTNEGLGALGRGEAIVCFAVASLSGKGR
jgi:2-C-methyl-D-erythritol 2,4-cyclodiphosphate synthase